MPILKTDAAFAEFCGVTPGATYKARHKGKLNKTKDGYDTNDPKNHAYAIGSSDRQMAQRGVVIPHESTENKSLSALETEKLKADIAIKKKTARKLDREHSEKMRGMIPVEVMTVWIGAFKAGIDTNFLTIAGRISKGDTVLRDRIEKEMSKAIAKTKEGAAKTLRDEAPAILEAINGTETTDN